MNHLTPRFDTLPLAQQRLWPALRPAASLGFVLYGGTALALRLGHRVSVDFDFFSDQPLDRVALAQAFPFLNQATVLQDRPDSFCALVPDQTDSTLTVKLSFFGGIGFGRIGEPSLTDDGVMQIASMVDLMATKLKVILQRAEAKDYRDIAAMLKAGSDLAQGLAAACQLFGNHYQPSESLKAMAYFGDGDLHTLKTEEKTLLMLAAGEIRVLPSVQMISKRLLA